MTDTLQLGETDDGEKLFSEMFPQNSARVQRQKKAPLRVIIGNPPYSIGQKSANDNAQNQDYPNLDNKIAQTYTANSAAGLNKSLYDAYVRAFRWSTDRLDKSGGIICFVSNGAWLDGNSTDGFRKSLEKEFNSIYVFNLRGNQRTSGELSKKEGGKIFGSGSRTPIAITLLVKKPNVLDQKATIHYRDIGEYLTREEKLAIIKKSKSVLAEPSGWQVLLPNEHGDWISQRNESFGSFIRIEPDKKFDIKANSFFVPYSLGLATNRDSWCYASSKEALLKNITTTVNFYNQQRKKIHSIKDIKDIAQNIEYDSTKINWTDLFIKDLTKNIKYEVDPSNARTAMYRPFFKQKVYFSPTLNHRPAQLPKFFPVEGVNNRVICLTGAGNLGFSHFITDAIPDLCLSKTGNGGCQTFPLYYFEERQQLTKGLFDEDSDRGLQRKDGISDFIYELCKKQYGKNISKEDIFYYVYGFLHSRDYCETFANDLKKMLPRLPLVEDVRDFWAFSKAGRKLADLHINYESVEPHPTTRVVLPEIQYQMDAYEFYSVEKMRFPKKDQKDTILYNSRIRIENIPAKAYEYVVNGKSAIEWIMERYQVTVHKESGIKNDPNDWSREVEKPSYILNLLLSIINVSVQTVDIVAGLPKVKF